MDQSESQPVLVRRRVAVISAAVLVLLGGTMAILFPGTGVMPISALDLIPPGLACAAVAVICLVTVIRIAVAVMKVLSRLKGASQRFRERLSPQERLRLTELTLRVQDRDWPLTAVVPGQSLRPFKKVDETTSGK